MQTFLQGDSMEVDSHLWMEVRLYNEQPVLKKDTPQIRDPRGENPYLLPANPNFDSHSPKWREACLRRKGHL